MRILTFDIEEWFHLLDHESTRTDAEWNNYEVRIHANVERILSVLENTGRRATFFCLGWIAERYPEVVRDIVDRGYDIASHGSMHQLVYEQTPDQFARDLERSVKTLEDIAGCKVRYYRCPGFSIREDCKWAFEIMAGQGIEVDSSVFPAPRGHGGFPSYREPVPSLLRHNGVELKELPINYVRLLGRPVIFSGGGYYRLFPYWLIRRWTGASPYVMSYLHPRDFDTEQPVIGDLSLARKFKSYVGLKGAAGKLERWLTDFNFVDVRTAVEQINWKAVPVVEV